MHTQDTTERAARNRGVTVIVPKEPPELNEKAARTLLKILFAVAESDRKRAVGRQRAA